jgi:hypothetical protein
MFQPLTEGSKIMQTETTSNTPDATTQAETHAAPEFVELTIAGKPFKVRTPGLGHYAAKEAFILSKRPDDGQRLLSVLKAELPDATKERLMLEIIRSGNQARFASYAEVSEFDASPLGTAWATWRAVSADHPGETLETIQEQLANITKAEALKLLPTLGLAG